MEPPSVSLLVDTYPKTSQLLEYIASGAPVNSELLHLVTDDDLSMMNVSNSSATDLLSLYPRYLELHPFNAMLKEEYLALLTTIDPSLIVEVWRENDLMAEFFVREYLERKYSIQWYIDFFTVANGAVVSFFDQAMNEDNERELLDAMSQLQVGVDTYSVLGKRASKRLLLEEAPNDSRLFVLLTAARSVSIGRLSLVIDVLIERGDDCGDILANSAPLTRDVVGLIASRCGISPQDILN